MQSFSFFSIFYRQQWWEKEEKVTIFLFLPGGLTGLLFHLRWLHLGAPGPLVTADLCLLWKGVASLSHTHHTFWGSLGNRATTDHFDSLNPIDLSLNDIY